MRLDINQFDLNNVAGIAFSKTGDAYTLTQTVGNIRYALFNNPMELPIGTRLKLLAEFKFISDFPGEISIVFFADNQHTAGEVDEGGTNSLDDTNDDWQKLEISAVVPAGAQYAQLRIGWIASTHTPGTDSFEFRNVRLEIDAGINTIFPELQDSLTFNQSFLADNIENAFELYSAGAGTATRNVDTYELRATGVVGDEAMLTLDQTPATADQSIYQPNAKFVKVRVKAKWNSGLPRIVVNFVPTYGTIVSRTSKYVYLVADSMAWHEAVFAVPDGTDVINIFAGMDTAVLGSVDIDAVQISLLGSDVSHGLVPFMANLLKTAGTWAIDDGVGVFSNINIIGIAQSATEITLTVNIANTKPIFQTDYLHAGASPEDYYAKIFDVDEVAGAVKIRLYTPGAGLVNPTTVTDGGIIQIMGFATV